MTRLEPMMTLDAMMDMIGRHRQSHISWHVILNNHASTRPTGLGGPLCKSVKACRTFKVIQGRIMCTLRIPNSFRKDDGIVLETTVSGDTQADAVNKVCQTAVAMLLCSEPGQVVLRAKHWNVSPQDLRVKVNEIRHPAGNEQVADLIRLWLRTDGDSLNPPNICQGEKVFSVLNNLLPSGSLRDYIEQHPEFQWKEEGDNGMMISWAEPGTVQLLAVLDNSAPWTPEAAELMAAEIWAEENVRLQPEPEQHRLQSWHSQSIQSNQHPEQTSAVARVLTGVTPLPGTIAVVIAETARSRDPWSREVRAVQSVISILSLNGDDVRIGHPHGSTAASAALRRLCLVANCNIVAPGLRKTASHVGGVPVLEGAPGFEGFDSMPGCRDPSNEIYYSVVKMLFEDADAVALSNVGGITNLRSMARGDVVRVALAVASVAAAESRINTQPLYYDLVGGDHCQGDLATPELCRLVHLAESQRYGWLASDPNSLRLQSQPRTSF